MVNQGTFTFFVLVGNDSMTAVLIGGYKVGTLIKDYIDNFLKDTNQTFRSVIGFH